MTIPGLIVLNVLVGVSVAYSARIQIRALQRPVFYNRYVSALLMLELMILMPVGIYFYAFYPDWSWMYLVDTARANGAVGVMAMLSYPIAACLGYLVGYYSARGESDWVSVMFMAFVAVGLVGLVAVAGEKLVWVGTYEQYSRNAGLRPFTSTSLLPSAILALCGIGVCWFHLIYRFVQEGRLSLRAM